MSKSNMWRKEFISACSSTPQPTVEESQVRNSSQELNNGHEGVSAAYCLAPYSLLIPFSFHTQDCLSGLAQPTVSWMLLYQSATKKMSPQARVVRTFFFNHNSLFPSDFGLCQVDIKQDTTEMNRVGPNIQRNSSELDKDAIIKGTPAAPAALLKTQ